MGKPLSASEETAQLKATIREAHETLKDLRAAIRDAQQIAVTLVAEFEAIHKREIELLSNHMTQEANVQSARLNAEVQRAQDMIFTQIMAGELVLDPFTSTVRLRLGPTRFDDQQPTPYPQVAPKETHQ